MGVASLAVLVVVGAVSLVRLATLQPQDYSALESELGDRGFDSDTRIELFGPLHIASYYLSGWNLVDGEGPVTPDDADVVLVDSSHSVRLGEPVVTGVAEEFELGRLSVYVLNR